MIFKFAECVAGTFGLGCTESCGQCLNPPCNNINGTCAGARCLDGWTGIRCNESKTYFI